ncbi:MAG: CoA transferase [Deltaproteobacteria bacterium]|nr:CoA transferase [Deltaproteobacteria bacterium]
MNGVLKGIRVLDFGRYIAGPYCATLLADLGAEVIRVERLQGSEDRFLASVAPTGEGGTFLQMARNKLGLTLDPMKPEAAEVVRRLVASADVVVANLPAPTLKAMGLDYETLRAIKPDIILTHVSAFGADGPYAERVGFDLLGQAMSGMMYLSGTVDAPIRSQVPYVDFSTAAFAAFGTLAALMERSRTGRGQIVEASLYASALALSNNFTIEEGVLGLERQPHGNRAFHHAPNDVFRTRDGHLITMVVGNPLFARWAKLVGVPEWIGDPRFDSDQKRGENGALISARMADWCAARTTAQALAEMEAARVPAGPVYTPRQTLDDPHTRARGIFKSIDYPGLPRPAPVAETPVRLSETPGGIRQRPPTLGEHTALILEQLGFTAAEVEDLRSAEVV